MHVVVHSNHPAGAFNRGRVEFVFEFEDTEAGQTRFDDVFFEVPPDFHVHNDLVAACVLTMIGQRATSVEFSFPISAHCADGLRGYYGIDAIGPVDPNMQPRRAGSRLGLGFSGGSDSMAAWAVLSAALGDELRVLTAEYDGYFEREAAGYSVVHRHVSCKTNLRSRRYDRGGRFNMAVPLLFADHVDLGSIATGHHYFHIPLSVESLRHGQRPAFIEHEGAIRPGGLGEAHVMRGLINTGILRILKTLAPDKLEPGLGGTGPDDGDKRVGKALTLRMLYEQAGEPLPAFLRDIQLARRPPRFGAFIARDVHALQMRRHFGHAFSERICPGIDDYDLSPLDGLSLAFASRYNTNFVGLLPDGIRNRVLDIFHGCGVYPYDERDFHELDVLRDYFVHLDAHRVRRRRRRR